MKGYALLWPLVALLLVSCTGKLEGTKFNGEMASASLPPPPPAPGPAPAPAPAPMPPPPGPTPPPVLPPGTDKWVKLSTRPNEGPYNPYFYCITIRDRTGEILMGWGRTYVFRDDTGWTIRNESTPAGTDPTKDIGRRENYGCTYDPDRDQAYIGNGGPVAYGFPGGPQYGEMIFDFATNLWSMPYPCPGSVCNGPLQITRFDGAYEYVNNKRYSFGSWGVGPGQLTAVHDLTTGVVTRFPTSTYVHPPWTFEHSRLMYLRSGVLNRTQETFWNLADDNELWIRNPSTGNWEFTATTGDKPTSKFISAAYDEDKKAIVAWAGADAISGGDTPPAVVNTTWVLDMSTLKWRKSLSLAAGHTVPPTNLQATNVMRYDRYNKRIILAVPSPFTEIWAFYLGNPL